jgi:hypothetical protein
MKFYNPQAKKPIDIPAKNIRHRMTANGKHMLIGMANGSKYYRFATKAEASKYPAEK